MRAPRIICTRNTLSPQISWRNITAEKFPCLKYGRNVAYHLREFAFVDRRIGLCLMWILYNMMRELFVSDWAFQQMVVISMRIYLTEEAEKGRADNWRGTSRMWCELKKRRYIFVLTPATKTKNINGIHSRFMVHSFFLGSFRQTFRCRRQRRFTTFHTFGISLIPLYRKGGF